MKIHKNVVDYRQVSVSGLKTQQDMLSRDREGTQSSVTGIGHCRQVNSEIWYETALEEDCTSIRVGTTKGGISKNQ